MGTVYIIHITPPYHHAKHYVGYTDVEERRFKRHKAGQGSRLLRAAVGAGHEIAVVHEYHGKDRNFERWLKNKGGASRYCPVCIAERAIALNVKRLAVLSALRCEVAT
jgi:predicted GIY-YIG superfamily endonuclease